MFGRKIALILAVALPASAQSIGAVVNADNHPIIAGDTHTGAILDEDTGRLWIDANETGGFSYNQISSLLGSGQEFAGWQLPQLSDVEELLLHADIPYPTSSPGDTLGTLPGFSQPISDFIDIFVDSPNSTSYGDQVELWVQWIGDEAVADLVLTDGEYGLMQHRAKVHISPPGVDRSDVAFASVGVFLFRDVPEPSTLLLGAMATMGLLMRTQRGRTLLERIQ